MSAATYPVHVEATLQPKLSRWLWLVKWLLAVPHLIVLVFLWIAFVISSIAAFFAILVTRHYPRALFEFNVGVLRWSWRVSYYTYGALGTDRYPPFTLADDPDYPAHLEIEYPAQLSRGLVLVKWWLLAIPHYLVVGVFLGGGTWALWQSTGNNAAGPGLVGLLVLFAAVALAVTGRYPQQIFDFVLGMNRWALRVAAYAALMTDEYPPFRLDLGGAEPGGAMTLAGAERERAATSAPEPSPSRPSTRRGWTGGRVTGLVVGCLAGLVSFGLLAGGAVAAWATNTQRDASGYLSTDPHSFSTAGYALVSDQIDLGRATDTFTAGDLLGTIRIRVTSRAGRAVFVGVAPQSAVDAYLRGVERTVISDWVGGRSHTVAATGAVPAQPQAAGIWTAAASGPGTQTLSWRPSGGSWVIVVMNADASPAVSVDADAGARVPDLGLIAAGLLLAGGLLLVLGVVLVAVPAHRAATR